MTCFTLQNFYTEESKMTPTGVCFGTFVVVAVIIMSTPVESFIDGLYCAQDNCYERMYIIIKDYTDLSHIIYIKMI